MNVVNRDSSPTSFAFCPASDPWSIADPCFQNLYLLTLPAIFASVLFLQRLSFFNHHGHRHNLGRTGVIYWSSFFLMLLGCIALVLRLIASSDEQLDLASKLATGSMLVSWTLAAILNHSEHLFSIRSSDAILGYYLAALAGSAVLYYTTSDLNNHQQSTSYLQLYIISLFLGLVVEAWPRGRTQVQLRSNVSVYDKSNLISRLSFHYIQPIMAKGYKRPLQLSDVESLMPERIRSENAYPGLATTWEKQVEKFEHLPKGKKEKKRPWLLLKVIFLTYGWTGWTSIILCRVASTTLVYLQPVLLGYIMDFMQSSTSETPQPLSRGIMLAFLMFLTSLFSSVMGAQLFQLNADRGMEIRSGLIGLIYRKTLRLSPEARIKSSTGEISNHMSVDAEKWVAALNTLPQWISAPIELVVALWMLYSQLGWCSLVGLFTILGLMPIQSRVSGIFQSIKETKLTAMDSRIRLVTELFTSIKTIKLYAWEDAFKAKIANYRQIEMSVLRRFGVVYAGMTLIFSTTMFMSLLSFGMFAAFGGPGGAAGEITPHVIFVSLSLFGLLSRPISTMDTLLSSTTSILVATRRVQKFLLSEELEVRTEDPAHKQYPLDPAGYEGKAIVVKNATFSWTKEQSSSDDAYPSDRDENTPLLENADGSVARNVPTLNGINFSLRSRSLTAVVGRIGQGKSSLLSALIGDMYKYNGSVQVRGRVAYVSQLAWIMNCSVKDNILFGKPLDQEKYDQVLDACCLRQDLDMLPARDSTEIGERGINLSGGQKQRVALARAAYADADIYLLDDPLSAVDAHVDQQLWQQLIGPSGLLKNKTRLLVTHGIHHLDQVDSIIVMKDGKISEMGDFVQLLSNRQGFYQLNLEFSSTHKRKSHKKLHGPEDVVPETASTSDSTSDADSSTAIAAQEQEMENPKAELVAAEKMVDGGVGWHMFMVYARAASLSNMIWVVVLYILVEVAQVGTSFWLRFWSDAAGQEKYSVLQFLLVYGGFTLAYLAFNVALFYVANVHAAILAARHLHDRLLNNLLRQPMSFFDVTPVGRIINRFSSDVENVDETIIWNFIDVVYCLVAIGGTLVVISTSTPLFLVAVPPLVLVYLYIQSYFIKSSQALKRFMSVSKSPLYQHFSETIAGVSTIRAMGANPRFITMNGAKADLSAETTLAFGIGNRWLKVRLEFLGALVVLGAALLAVLDQGHLSASVVGLSLTYAMNVTGDITWLVRSFSELQNQLVCVERIEEYAELRTEAPLETAVRLPKNWPSEGKVEFKNYSSRYREGLDLVIKNVSFEVKPAEKVGIVGRTGAGKSSLTLALFRMIEAADSYWARATVTDSSQLLISSWPRQESDLDGFKTDQGGSIEIDGVDIATLGLKTLREHLSIIPQDPTLFAGTVRENLDPFSEREDAELWTALERAHLKDHIASLVGGLSFEVAQNGENFSVGQRSLICLARALLRKTKILILDEATAAVDMETDDLIQRTIRKEFKDRTILTIAHRIKTVMDSDKILVLEKGCVEEYEAPAELLKKRESLFYKLAEQAGELKA
ncbi:ATP-binding cassette, subfamily C (CFTR/MRP), member 1 [Entomortierella parvispora]|uniref:ATP-binding cassette, subfamily C (CFTR/MRP), member 1 n=1 Tax=Entomortierella parvispora TaxID=205924 RepID=A0A9P3HA51_9FUNG|nr:ATP-binding cassette, subfamily C (CFTR/MRP), member 1 [Entomortierella parvispora]